MDTADMDIPCMAGKINKIMFILFKVFLYEIKMFEQNVNELKYVPIAISFS